jgi:hypothetical protein
MIGRIFTLFLFFVLLFCQPALAGCRQFIELHSAADVAREMGTTEAWVVGNYKIKLWKKSTAQGRFPAVGNLLPGSRALLLKTSGPDFQVKSPYDGSTGWVNQLQVSGILMQDDITFMACD